MVLKVKNLPTNAEDTRDMGSVLGLRRYPEIGNGNPLQSVFLTGKSQGQRSLAGYNPWDHKESDVTKQLSTYMLSL